MVTITKEVENGYNYLNRSMTPALCINVPAHIWLYKTSESGVLIDCLRQSGCHRSRHLNQIKGLDDFPMDIQMAQVQQAILKRYGVELNDDFYKMHLNALVTSYLVYSSLCFLQTEGANGVENYYVTKQRSVLEGLVPSIVPKDIAKLNTDYFNDHYKTTISELTEAKHKVITLKQDTDGFHLAKRIIYSNSKNNFFYPVYVVRNYKKALLGVLRNKVVRVTCVEAKDEGIKFVTSLNGDALCRWMRTTQVARCQRIWQGVEDTYYEANLTLPNLSTPSEFVTINLFHIKNVEILS